MNRLRVCGLSLLLCCARGQQQTARLETVPSSVAELDGWVEARHALAADGQTEFVSAPDDEQPRDEIPQLWLPHFDEPQSLDTGPMALVQGDYLLSLSRFRGLVITDLTDLQGLRLAASLPIEGLPVGLAVADGVATVAVLDALAPGCFDRLRCATPPTSRVILVEVQVPTKPRVLAEQRIEGLIAATRQVGQQLYVLTRRLPVYCSGCDSAPPAGRWLTFDRSDVRQLPSPSEVPASETGFLDSALESRAFTGREVVDVGDQLLIADDVSVSRHAKAAAPADGVTSRLDLTRSVSGLSALSNGLALFGADLDSKARTLELVPGRDSAEPLDVPTALGLPRTGSEEDRRWGRIFERAGTLYALRLHRPTEAQEGEPSAIRMTLHAFDPAAASGADSAALELPILLPGECYLGTVQTENALLVARGRLDASAFCPLLADEFAQVLDSNLFDPRDRHPGAKLSYDVVSLSADAPRLAARFEVAPEVVQNGLLHFVRDATLDAAWGFHSAKVAFGPVVEDGTSLFGQHVELLHDQQDRLGPFYLERFEFSDPSGPRRLDPVNIPGTLLDVDSASGALLTLETLWLEEPAGDAGCQGRGYDLSVSIGSDTCRVRRRALNGLILEGDHATRVGQVLLDGSERRVVKFAVSGGRVYYLTQARELASDSTGPFAPRSITLERVVLRDGQLERLPSLDISDAASFLPEHWQRFVARGDRALWVSGSELAEADFRDGTAHVQTHPIGLWGCQSLDLRDDSAFCARGLAGYLEVPLRN